MLTLVYKYVSRINFLIQNAKPFMLIKKKKK